MMKWKMKKIHINIPGRKSVSKTRKTGSEMALKRPG